MDWKPNRNKTYVGMSFGKITKLKNKAMELSLKSQSNNKKKIIFTIITNFLNCII